MASNNSEDLFNDSINIQDLLAGTDLNESWNYSNQDMAMSNTTTMWGQPGDESHPIYVSSSPERDTFMTSSPIDIAPAAYGYTPNSPEKERSDDERRDVLNFHLKCLHMAKGRREVDIDLLQKQIKKIDEEIKQTEDQLNDLQKF